MNRKNLGSIATWLIVTCIFLILFSRVKMSGVIDAVRRADIAPFLVSLFISLLANFLISPARYREILKIVGCDVSFAEAAVLKLGSAPVKAALPFKMGELVRVAYLKKVYHLSYARGFGSIILGYALSLLALVVLILSGWLSSHFPPPQTLVYVAALALCLIVAVYIASIVFSCSAVGLARLLAYSFGFECSRILNFFLLFKAFTISVPLSRFLLCAPVSLFASDIPLTPWGLGMGESAIVTLFSNHASPETLLATGMVMSFVNRLFPAILCMVIMKPFLTNLSSHTQRNEA